MPLVLRALSIALVLVFAVAGCSSSNGTDDAATGEQTPTTDSTIPTTVAAGESPTPSTTVATDAPDAGKSGDIDVFCGLFQDRVDGLVAFVANENALLDPAAFETFADQQLVLLEQAEPYVPAEVAADFEQALDDARLDHELFAEFGFDAGEIFQSQLITPTMSPSNPGLERFVAEECGIERDGEPVSSADASLGSPAELAGDAEALAALLETESGRQAIVDQLSEMLGLSEDDARCLVDTVDLSNITALAAADQIDPDALVVLFAALETCEIPLSALISATS